MIQTFGDQNLGGGWIHALAPGADRSLPLLVLGFIAALAAGGLFLAALGGVKRAIVPLVTSIRPSTRSQTTRHDLFISYAHLDDARVRPIVTALKDVGWSVWWDRGGQSVQTGIPVGERFRSAILDAHKNATLVVVFWTAASIQSEWVLDEAERAKVEGKLFGIRLDDIMPPPGFTQRTYFDLIDWGRTTPRIMIKNLSETIAARLASPESESQIPFHGEAWRSRAAAAALYRRRILISASASLAIMALFLGPNLFHQQLPRDWKVSIEGNCWAVYDPQDFDPRFYSKYSNHYYDPRLTGSEWSYRLRLYILERLGLRIYRPVAGYGPEHYEKSISHDLDFIRKAGFTGVVTHGSYGPLSLVPRVASEKGLKVIMGVWDVRNIDELNVAASQARFVEGYVVGFSGLSNTARTAAPDAQASPEMISESLARLRRHTGRPVATQLHFWDLDRFPVASAMGDWLFVDPNDAVPEQFIRSFPSEYKNLTTSGPGEEIKRFINHIRTIKNFARDRPYILSSATFPAMGPEGEKEQAEYYQFLTEETSHLLDTGALSFATHTAFDARWKGPPFAAWERFTGVLESGGRPRIAAGVLATHCKARV